MLIGRSRLRVDDKWRLRIPVVWREEFGGAVYLEEDELGCLRIHPEPPPVDRERAPFCFKQKVDSHGVSIPEEVRDSRSFFYGREVMLVGRQEFLEVWPWKGEEMCA